MKTILVTGASGFFGRSVLESLQKRKEDFRVFCIFFGEKPTSFEDARFIWLEWDLLDLTRYKDLMALTNPSHCIHLAWFVPPGEFWHSLANIQWLHASILLFESFCVQGGQIFLGAGSLAEYDWTYGLLDEEKTPLVPATLYGQAKKSLCEILFFLKRTRHNKTTLLWPRIGYFFGEYEPSQKLMKSLCSSIYNQKPFHMMPADTARPYAHVKYAGKFLSDFMFLQSEDAIFNVSSTYVYSLHTIASTVGTTLGKSIEHIKFGAYHPLIKEPKVVQVSTDKAEALGMSIRDTFLHDLENFARNVTSNSYIHMEQK